MALSEIEKLERRYAENPQGLTFAPLAEVHRKTGEVQRALDLLGPGLEIHPDYIPASIVLGRCHMDLGDVHAAETAFLHVLALDGENVIALRALADISERLLKFDDAERWLHTLLSVDRSNDDAREQLQRVEISRRQAEVASSAAPGVVEAVTPFEPPVAEPAVGWVSQSGQVPNASLVQMEDLEPSALREPFEEPAASRFLESTAVEEPVVMEEPAPMEEPVPVLDSVEPLDGLVGREVHTPDPAGEEFRVETSEDIVLQSAGGSEFQMPDASQELFASGGPGERAPFEEDAPIAPAAAWQAPPATPTEPEAVSPPEAVESPEPAAVAVAAEPPPAERNDFRYHRRDEGREPQAPSPPPRRSYAAGQTGGRSVAQLFQGILSARPPAQASAAPVRQGPAAASAGAPTRPASDALSLSSVFGEEASETPPAVSASSPGAGPVSFDDFFSSPTASPAARTPRAPDPKNDDLDQFHAWLQNLKR
ncbi:MAG: hypothetical protein H0T50_05270 [Gemmatimonadales bacterium]|nr:hypothetical protein [Gemmatimonadales bacterium]